MEAVTTEELAVAAEREACALEVERAVEAIIDGKWIAGGDWLGGSVDASTAAVVALTSAAQSIRGRGYRDVLALR